MNRSHILAAFLSAASCAASAQSSISLFGTVDATVAIGRGSIANRTQLTNSGYASSAIGFRGVEDLGGGLSASFWLEAAIANDDGQGGASNSNNQASGAGASPAGGQGLTFNRRATVSLAADWGELRLGRDYTPHYWNHALFDPFVNKGVGASQVILSSLAGVTGVRVSNAVGYFTPRSFGAFYGQYQHFLGENSSGSPTSSDGDGDSIRVGYEAGRANAAVAMGRVKYAAGDITTMNLGGSYNFDVATVMGMYDRDRVGNGATGKGWLLGFRVPLGAGEIRGSYSTYETSAFTTPRTAKLAVGYVHNLSKRTALYATAASVKNAGNAAVSLNRATTGPGQGSTGLDLGISHKF